MLKARSVALFSNYLNYMKLYNFSLFKNQILNEFQTKTGHSSLSHSYCVNNRLARGSVPKAYCTSQQYCILMKNVEGGIFPKLTYSAEGNAARKGAAGEFFLSLQCIIPNSTVPMVYFFIFTNFKLRGALGLQLLQVNSWFYIKSSIFFMAILYKIQNLIQLQTEMIRKTGI